MHIFNIPYKAKSF